LPVGADSLPTELRAVLELFGTELAKVSFPDVDAAVLRRHADEVKARQRDVEQARAALQVAQAELERRTLELAALATRGLAYARIYSSAHPERSELAARLANLEVQEQAADQEANVAAPRRGRRRAPRPELPFDLGTEAAPAPPLTLVVTGAT
jgi:hypothetical protein